MTVDEFRRLVSAPDRWPLVRRFVASWHRPLRSGDGHDAETLDGAERRLGHTLPRALLEWYGLVGHRPDLVNRQDALRSPLALRIEHGCLFFHFENQGCCAWGIREDELALPDPPVYLRNAPTYDSLPSELILEAGSVPRGGAGAIVASRTEEALARFAKRFPAPWEFPESA